MKKRLMGALKLLGAAWRRNGSAIMYFAGTALISAALWELYYGASLLAAGISIVIYAVCFSRGE